MYMQGTILRGKGMSFDFGASNINQFKAQAAYKDGGGMGGGGMYMKQNKKRKDQPDDDLFEFSEDKKDSELIFDSEPELDEIPHDNIVNKFVNWFRINKTS